MLYLSKPVQVEAILWRGNVQDIPAAWLPTLRITVDTIGTAIIDTLEGPARVHKDRAYIVRGTVGEYYPVRRDIFEAKYDQVEVVA